jgi:endonuclease/exonuclease/phosphatase family metal-dependent hydrolase
MKTIILALIITLLSQGVSAQTASCKDYRAIVTWNIRFNNPADGVNAWPNRKDKVTGLLRDLKPGIICLQEVLKGQLEDLAGAFPEYGYVGVGRDDGKSAGEYVPVLFRKDCFELIRYDHFWLSSTPDKPGVLGWDAACARMVTWLSLLDKQTGDTLFVFNTHFDHVGKIAREMSAGMLAAAADSLAGSHHTFITGDFNSTPDDPAYLTVLKAGFQDSRLFSKSSPKGPDYTFTTFSTANKPGGRIDYIFTRNVKKIRNYLVRTDNDGTNYFSDHLPVTAGF